MSYAVFISLSLCCHLSVTCFSYLYFRGIDFGELLLPEVRAKHKHTAYDLIANIVHDGEPGSGKGSYRAHILHKVCGLQRSLSGQTSFFKE